MMARASRRRLLPWVLSACAPVAAQQATGPVPGPGAADPSALFGEVVDVRVVNVEVVVTDREGRRVTGLDADQFELRVDGEATEIAYFSEVVDGRLAAAAPSSATAGPQRVPATGEDGAVARNFLVFIDEFFTLARDRDLVLDRLMEQVAQLGPADRMALVRYDGDLEMLSTWTRDRALLRQILSEQKGRPNLGLRRLAQDRALLFDAQRIDLLERNVGRLQLTLEERALVERLSGEVEQAVRAATASLRSFAAPPGRRMMLLLSGGWPFSPAEYLIDDTVRILGDADLLRGDRLFTPLRDSANRLGYTIYPVDVPGFQANSIDIARDFGSQRQPDDLRPRTFNRETNVHQSLFYLAEQTGGRALINSQRDGVLQDVLADTGRYYWLGFVPADQGDDKRHEIEVLVKDRGLEVRSRQDYFDFSREQETTLAVESALYFGQPPSTTPLAVRLGRGERAGLRTMIVPLEVGIPASFATFLPVASGWAARLELRIAVLDENGATTDTPVIPLDLTAVEKPADNVVLQYGTRLKLRRRRHTLVVALFDVASGEMASSSVEVDP